MRPNNQNAIFYTPEPIPAETSQLSNYLERELDKLKIAIDLLALGHLDETFVAPTKPRNGDLRYADGTSWNPGAGRGVYVYKGSSWVLLG